MPVATPTDRAIAEVEKAIKASDSAAEKAEKLQEKADEASAAANRAARVVKHAATHPDLPEDFDLDEFRRSLAEPFEDEATAEDEVHGVIDPDSDDPHIAAKTATLDVEDDDPFADEDAA